MPSFQHYAAGALLLCAVDALPRPATAADPGASAGSVTTAQADSGAPIRLPTITNTGSPETAPGVWPWNSRIRQAAGWA